MTGKKGHVGPERLFYDKECYTGIHRNVGSTSVETNLVEPSYHLDRSASDVRGVKVEQKQRRGPKSTQEKLEGLRSGWHAWSVTGLAKGLLRPLPTLAATERMQVSRATLFRASYAMCGTNRTYGVSATFCTRMHRPRSMNQTRRQGKTEPTGR